MPSSTRVEEPDHRAAALRRLRRMLGDTYYPSTGARALEYSTGPVVVEPAEFSCFPPVDPESQVGPDATVSGAEAFLASPCTCLVHVKLNYSWCSHPEIVLELRRDEQGWAPLACGLWWNSDVVAIGMDGRILVGWDGSFRGSVRIDGSDSEASGAIRCDLRLESRSEPDDGIEGRLNLVARFAVAPEPMPANMPFIVERFIEDAHVSERW